MSDLHEIVHSDDPNWPWHCSCGEEFHTSRKHALYVREALLADPAILDALAPLVADRERAAAALLAARIEPILALLHHRGLVDNEHNREDVAAALKIVRAALEAGEDHG